MASLPLGAISCDDRVSVCVPITIQVGYMTKLLSKLADYDDDAEDNIDNKNNNEDDHKDGRICDHKNNYNDDHTDNITDIFSSDFI